ncbi:hypothetical protein QVD17_08079 [Tagetes erecta]|uniref:Uncharacterized protein n=1 Tax=Tagetes erecta TaxID=13708 RepID=A0AAD8L2F8_TARER|nr:hypothetical protein QVD17_08079 [Tagetes erecta]
MASSTKTTLLISFLLLVYILSNHIADARPVNYSLDKDGSKLHPKKHSMLDATLDYDDAGPNPKHDPRKGRGGGSGKNP